jgi:hypothetical protein
MSVGDASLPVAMWLLLRTASWTDYDADGHLYDASRAGDLHHPFRMVG